jgi:hypothetical protein
MKMRQEGLSYAADFKVPAKLMARVNPVVRTRYSEEE